MSRPGGPAAFTARHAGAARRALLLAALLALGGCGPGGPIRWDLHPDVVRPEPGVVILLADGLPPRMVAEGCQAGWLPNIRQRFWDGGLRVQRATSALPSITYAAIGTLLTGVSPARHGVVGNHWFDPEQALYRNYATIAYYRAVNADLRAPLLYERIGPEPSASIQAAHLRGVTKNIANWAVSGTKWFLGDFSGVDKLTAGSLWRVARWANAQRRWPTVLTCYFPGLDSIGHVYGASSADFRWALEHLDYQVGRVCAYLESQGLLDSTYLLLVSDHGMLDVDPAARVDLLDLIRRRWGRNATGTMRQEGPYAQRRRFYDRYDTVVAYHDGRAAALHLAGPDGWATRPEPAQVEAILHAPPEDARLWNVEGVGLAMWLAADDEAVLRTAAGAARVRARPGRDGPEYAYLPDPEDVLGYRADGPLAAFVAAGFHESRAWLAATADAEVPDLVPHVIDLLHERRAGQVVLFAAPGYSFICERGGHGGIYRDERLMTLLLAGPGIAPGTLVETARAVDVLPTVLALLGLEADADEWLEGTPLPGIPSSDPTALGAAR